MSTEVVMSDNTPSATAKSPTVPITKARVAQCRESAEYWARELPRYADRKQRQADGWAIAAGVVVALTGLSIWPVSTETSATWIRLIVAGGALAAAICALVPRVYNFGELAGQAREISGKYGDCYGDLIDLDEGSNFDPAAASIVVADFQAAKARKDGLRGMPLRPLQPKTERNSGSAQAYAELTAQVAKLTLQLKELLATKPIPATTAITPPAARVSPQTIEPIPTAVTNPNAGVARNA